MNPCCDCEAFCQYVPLKLTVTINHCWCLLSHTESDHHNYMCNVLKSAIILKMSLECQNTQLKPEQHPGLSWCSRKCFLLPLNNPPKLFQAKLLNWKHFSSFGICSLKTVHLTIIMAKSVKTLAATNAMIRLTTIYNPALNPTLKKYLNY